MKQKMFHTLHRESDNRLYAVDENGNKEELRPWFPLEEWNCPEAFAFAGVKGYEPMTAKELETEEKQDEQFASESNIIEEKFDGTRGINQYFSQPNVDGSETGYSRVFSRRISKKSGFYTENTDSVPHIREIDVPELDGTILDGEMFINGQPFKEVSSTLNCLWDKAVDRQIEKGFISLHAFDIIKYKGIDLRKMSLINRKQYLKQAVEETGSKYIEFVPFYVCGEYLTDPYTGEKVYARDLLMQRIEDFNDDYSFFERLENDKEVYPNLYRDLNSEPGYMTPRGYYELIVSTGGEGVILKSKEGRYHHKRGWEYSKVKKFLTRECVIMGFTEPTDLYDGVFPNDSWSYWVDVNDDRMNVSWASNQSAKELLKSGKFKPVTRFYYYHMIGNIRYGVVITPQEIENLPKSKKFNIQTMMLEGKECQVVEVGDCSGYNDDMRNTFSFSWVNKKTGDVVRILPGEESSNKHITESKDWEKYTFEGEVVEVKANELFKDTGKMRHPRFFRMRPDKSPLECIWKDHISAGGM